MQTTGEANPYRPEQGFIDDAIARSQGRPGALLSVLEDVQGHHPSNYLPAETLAPMYKTRLEQYQQTFGFR